MDAQPQALRGTLPYVRISLVHNPEKQARQIEAFAQALATCRGNQVWLAERMDERDRQIRRQIATGRKLGTDIPLRAIAIMREQGIVPYLVTPPGSVQLTDVEEIFTVAIERASARAETRTPERKRKAAKKAAAKKKAKPKRTASKRPV